MSEPNWVDYTNLGLNVANTALNAAQFRELGEINGQLLQLGQLEADRERRRQYETTLRQFLFDEETKLDRLKEDTRDHPILLWLGAQLIKHNINSVPITAASFQEFVDKDRVRKVESELAATIRETEARLDPGQQSDARLALKYLLERSALDEYIAMRVAQETLPSIESERATLEGKLSETGTGNTLILLGGLVAEFTVVPFVGLFLAGFLNEAGVLPGVVGLILFAIGGMIAWPYAIYRLVNRRMIAQGPTKLRFDELTVLRDEARNKIPPAPRQDALRTQFGGDTTIPQLKDWRSERESVIAGLLAAA